MLNNCCFDVKEMYEKSYDIRYRFLEVFTRLGYGHLTTAFSEVEILICLLECIIRYDSDKKPIDKFVLSKGHGGGMVFPILEDMGVLSKDDMFNVLRKGGDINLVREYMLPGFEFYGGSLGIGFGMAAGLALGLMRSRSNAMVYCLMGDAECYEGSVWESMLFSAHNRLNNLVVVIDRNNMGCSDFTENMCALEPFAEKWIACNWNVVKVNGHSYEELFFELDRTRKRLTDKPTCIIADTIKGKGLEYLCNIPLKHGYMPKGDDIAKAYNGLERFQFERHGGKQNG